MRAGQTIPVPPATTTVRVLIGRDEPRHRPSVLAWLGAALEIVTGFGNVDLDGPDLRPLAFVHRGAAEEPEMVGRHRLLSTNGAVRTEERPGPGAVSSLSFVVDLTRLLPDTSHVVFLMASSTGHDFRRVRNCYCSLADHRSGQPLGRIDLPGPTDHNVRVLARLTRGHGACWTFGALDGRHHATDVAGIVAASDRALTDDRTGA